MRWASTSYNNDDADTIFALSSGAATTGPTAVAVVRLSGPKSHDILDKMTDAASPPVPTRKAVVRKLVHPQSGDWLDQALVLKFAKPASFTGQDVVELHLHGSRAVVSSVLETLGQQPNVRLAERGEFTQRAFEASKLDLLQVEALADLLTADTQKQRQQALQQLDGKLSQLYDAWRMQLTKGLAHAEAVIDFGDDEHLSDDVEDDYEIGQASIWGGVEESMQNLCSSMQKHLSDARRGELVREGIKICILGPPNAGKSSLFNILAQRDAAIVSPVEGTTRDVLELTLDLGGVRCILSDTAGVRQDSNDMIEIEGIKRAQAAAERADLLIAMVDGTCINDGLEAVRDVVSNKEMMDRMVLVVNKVDLLDGDAEMSDAPFGSPHSGTFSLSCDTNKGFDDFLDGLTDRIVDRVSKPAEERGSDGESALITRTRHRQHVQDAVEALQRFSMLAKEGSVSVDLAAEELRRAVSELGRVTGAIDVEDVLDVLFADFCIGK